MNNKNAKQADSWSQTCTLTILEFKINESDWDLSQSQTRIVKRLLKGVICIQDALGIKSTFITIDEQLTRMHIREGYFENNPDLIENTKKYLKLLHEACGD